MITFQPSISISVNAGCLRGQARGTAPSQITALDADWIVELANVLKEPPESK